MQITYTAVTKAVTVHKSENIVLQQPDHIAFDRVQTLLGPNGRNKELAWKQQQRFTAAAGWRLKV